MLVIERTARTVRALPLLTQVGFAALFVGLVLDVLAHLGWASGMVAGHLLTLAGMVVALAGVLVLAVHGPRENHLAEKRRQE